MFKNMTMFSIENDSILSANEMLDQYRAALKDHPLTPPLQSEFDSTGWLPVMHGRDHYAEMLNDAIFIRFGTDKKILPKAAIDTEVNRVITEEKGLDPDGVSRVERMAIAEAVTSEMLSSAPSVRESMLICVDVGRRLLIVDSSTPSKTSMATSLLRKSLGTLPIVPLVPRHSVGESMTRWVEMMHASEQMEILSSLEISEPKDDGGKMRFSGVSIDAKEIQGPIKNGWSVVKLRMLYDDAVSFTIEPNFLIKGIKTLEAYEEKLSGDEDKTAAMQSRTYLAVDTMRSIIDNLMTLIDGESL